MKTKLLAFALLLGLVGIVEAGGRKGQGWNVTVTTGNTLTIGGNGQTVFLNRIILSSGTQASQGDYLMAFSTIPSIALGTDGATLFGGPLFQSTATVVPAMVFLTTTSASSVGAPNLNNVWSAGECDDCYVEVSGPRAATDVAPQPGALVIRLSSPKSGAANQATVHWSY